MSSKSSSVEKDVHEVINRIRQERERQGYSQMDLALKAGISQGYLGHIETFRKVPTIATIIKLAKALEIDPSLFFKDKDMDREKTKNEILEKIRKEL